MQTLVVPGVFREVAGPMLPSTLPITFDGGPGTGLAKGLLVELFCGVGPKGGRKKRESNKTNDKAR